MATLTKKDSISEWNGYKIGDKVELAFIGQWLQDSTRFPILDKYYWVKGKVIEVYEKACIVKCSTIGLNRVMVMQENGIRHYDTDKKGIS